MRVDSTRGTVRDVFQAHTPQVRLIARTLRKLIAEIHPSAVETPRPSENHVSYSLGTEKASEVYSYLCPLKDYVRLGFYFGGRLPDPDKLLVGTGKRLRHIKIYSVQEAKRPAVRALVQAAVAEREKAHERAQSRRTTPV